MKLQILVFSLALSSTIVNGENKKSEKEPCTSTDQCYNGLECRENLCRCPVGKRLGSLGSTSANCVPVLGSSCEGHDDCDGMKGAQCGNSKCDCPVGVSAESKECIPILKSLEDKCQIHSQCIHLIGDYAQCKNDRCSCKQRYYYNEQNDMCEKAKGLHEMCHKNEECYLKYDNALVCSNNVCQCAEGFELVHDYCENGASVAVASIATIFTAIGILWL